MPSFDDLIVEIGHFGLYQKLLCVTMVLAIIPGSYNTFLPMFILTIPKHRCALDGSIFPNDTYESQNPLHKTLINISIPLVKSKGDWIKSSCEKYELNMTVSGNSGITINNKDYSYHNENLTVHKCSRFVYDKTYFDRTVIEELDIVCDRKTWRAHANMAMMFGKLVSALVQGIFSDSVGRRKTFLVFVLILIGNTFANAFIYNIPSLLAFRFLAGLATTSIFLNCYVIVLEFLSPQHRRAYSTLQSLVWTFGGYILTGVAFGLRDFQHLVLTLAAPTVLLISYFFLVPESPRWLIAKGKVEEARKLLEKVAKRNGKEFPEDMFYKMIREENNSVNNFRESDNGEVEIKREKTEKQNVEKAETIDKKEGGETFVVMFRYPGLVTRLGIVMWNLIINSMAYYGIMFNVQNLSGSIYLNFFLTNCADLFGTVLSFFLIDRFGRKLIYQSFLLIAGLACLTSIFPTLYATQSVLNTSFIVISLIGRAGISTSFNLMFLYCAELFPTSVRNSALGASSMMSRVGSISAPYVADLGKTVGGDMGDALPLLIFGTGAFTAFLLAFLLPETMGQKLPATCEEALDIGKTLKKHKTGKRNSYSLKDESIEGQDLNSKDKNVSTISHYKI